eukprot:2220502-Heterocapsa_arctica.AAC.1
MNVLVYEQWVDVTEFDQMARNHAAGDGLEMACRLMELRRGVNICAHIPVTISPHFVVPLASTRAGV